MLVDSPMAQSVYAPSYTNYTSQDLKALLAPLLRCLLLIAVFRLAREHPASPHAPATAPRIVLPRNRRRLAHTQLLSAPYKFFGVGAGGFSDGGRSGASMAMDTTSMSSTEMSAVLDIDPQLVGSSAPVTSFSDLESSSSSSSQHDSTSPPATSPEGAPSPAGDQEVFFVLFDRERERVLYLCGEREQRGVLSTPLLHGDHDVQAQPRGGSKRGDDEDDEDDLPADRRRLQGTFVCDERNTYPPSEDSIAERDRLLSAIHSALGSTQSENLALPQEIAALKRSLLDNRRPAPTLLPPSRPPHRPCPPSLPLPPYHCLHPHRRRAGRRICRRRIRSRTSPPRPDSGAAGTPTRAGLGWAVTRMSVHTVHTAHRIELFGTGAWSASSFAEQENLNPALNDSTVTEVLRAELRLGAATGARVEFGCGPHVPPGRMAQKDRHNMEHGHGAAAAGSASPKSPSSSSSSPTSSPTAPHAHAHTSIAFLGRGLALLQRLPYLEQRKCPRRSSTPRLLRSRMRAYRVWRMGCGRSILRVRVSRVGQATATAANGLAAALAGLSLSGRGGAQAQMHARQREVQREAHREKDSQSRREYGDAFSGAEGKAGSSSLSASCSSYASSSSNAGRAGARGWDAEKVWKVLEGRAVVRVVDVEPPSSPKVAPMSPRITAAAAAPSVQQQQEKKCPSVHLAECLEETSDLDSTLGTDSLPLLVIFSFGSLRSLGESTDDS
ncbi:hypothetical protein B0H19DRAFT_1256169 [Mycena capillaripes]|nr:hypothetical protein B0H19DRAFT_1256169 [Mycena capillaripes]